MGVGMWGGENKKKMFFANAHRKKKLAFLKNSLL